MDPQNITDLASQALQTAMIIALPVLGVALIVGLVVTTIQAMTQIHDQTIGSVAKIVAVFLVLLLCMPWLIDMMSSYSHDLIESIPNTLSGRQ